MERMRTNLRDRPAHQILGNLVHYRHGGPHEEQDYDRIDALLLENARLAREAEELEKILRDSLYYRNELLLRIEKLLGRKPNAALSTEAEAAAYERAPTAEKVIREVLDEYHNSSSGPAFAVRFERVLVPKLLAVVK